MSTPVLNASTLEIDCVAEVERNAAWLRDIIGRQFRRRGAIIALSGGVDSSVCAALAVRSLGAPKVLGLLLPERESSSRGTDLGRRVAEQLGIEVELQDITSVLEAIGCYRRRDEAIRTLFPDYRDDWKNKLVIAGGLSGQFNFFKLVVQSPDGRTFDARIPHREYLQIVAAQNYKQRVRKTVEYFHADRMHYAVIGTPNRLEYDQGFFVKNGDGSADVKPIAHLYKTQVYTLARHLGLPLEVCNSVPSTDTYSLQQTQDEFYFGLAYPQMDLALWASNHQVPAAVLANAIGIGEEQAKLIYRDIEAKRQATRYLHARPLLVEAIPGLPALV